MPKFEPIGASQTPNLLHSHLGQLLMGLPEPVLITNCCGEVLFINLAVPRRLGFSQEALVGKNIDLILPIPLAAIELHALKKVHMVKKADKKLFPAHLSISQYALEREQVYFLVLIQERSVMKLDHTILLMLLNDLIKEFVKHDSLSQTLGTLSVGELEQALHSYLEKPNLFKFDHILTKIWIIQIRLKKSENKIQSSQLMIELCDDFLVALKNHAHAQKF